MCFNFTKKKKKKKKKNQTNKKLKNNAEVFEKNFVSNISKLT